MKKKRRKSSIVSKSKVTPACTVQAGVFSKDDKAGRKRPGGIGGGGGQKSIQDTKKSVRRKDTKIHGVGGIKATSEILRQAAYAVGRLVEADGTGKRGVSLKSLTLGNHVKQKKAVYAVTVETLKYYTVLEEIGRSVGIEMGGDYMSMATSCVLIKEIVLGSGLSRIGAAEKRILAHEKEIKNKFMELMKKKGVHEASGLLPENALALAAERRRRTVRVNTLKATIKDVKKRLEQDFGSVHVNQHIPEVLELDPGTDLHCHHLVKNGSIVLQSLASCIPAFVLNPICSWNVLDACAAPGNKTTHIAAIMSQHAHHHGGNIGHVVALDKDSRRLERLKNNATITGAASIINPFCNDFLKTNPNEYMQIDAILLDPSCSGSGTSVSRMDYLLPSSQKILEKGVMYTDNRTKQLSEFQIVAVKHAMAFPHVKRIVYSTCSVYYEENEGVISQVLEYAQNLGFRLTECFPGWHRRGIATSKGLGPEDASKVLRIDPIEDGTDGFFVAMFEK